MSIKTRLVYIALAFITAFALNIALTTRPATAGSNGQQVGLTYTTCYSGASATYIRITGYNQNNQFAAFDYVPAPGTCGGSSTVVTTGYFWKGTVKVSVIYPSYARLCVSSVPTTYPVDVYPVSCQ